MGRDKELSVCGYNDRAHHLANVAALQQFDILDSAPEAVFDHIVEIAARVFSVPTALVSLIDFDRQWFKARVGMQACETSLEVSFCKHAVLQDKVFVINDATKDDRFAENALVTSPGGIRFYAGAPLITSDGFAVGTLCIIDSVAHSHFGNDDRTLLKKIAALVVDVMEGRASRVAIVEANKKLEDFTSASLDIFWETDRSHRFTQITSQTLNDIQDCWDRNDIEVQEAIERMIGCTRWEILGVDVTQEPWQSHLQTLEARHAFRDMRYSMTIGEETVHLSASGRPVYDETGSFIGYRGATHNVTGQERARLDALQLANSDPLTGLANRRFWNAALEGRLKSDRVPPTGILLLDVDRFKDINDALGHAVGDALLVEIAKRIVDCSECRWLTARLGGDEFAVLIKGDEHAVIRSANCIVASMERPIEVGGHTVQVELSIGIKIIDQTGCDAQQAMVDADLALRSAKTLGRNRHVLFEPPMRAENDNRIQITSQLEGALQNGEFELYYQPQLRLSNRAVVGMEALLRWNHPVRGLLAPDEFLTALETSSFDIPIGRYVIASACKQARHWQDLGIPVRIGINVSASQLYGDDLPSTLHEEMTRYGTAATLLEIEVTERVALGNVEKIRSVLERINAMGVTIAFDDFGTGFASLCSLMQFPLDRVKIDRRFVTDVTTDTSSAKLTSGLVHLCHSLGFEVIAEGVETLEHEAFLRTQNCDEVQGFLYSRPLDAAHATNFLMEHITALKRSKLVG